MFRFTNDSCSTSFLSCVYVHILHTDCLCVVISSVLDAICTFGGINVCVCLYIHVYFFDVDVSVGGGPHESGYLVYI